ncbi:MAG: glycosyltransferase family 4 protein [Immundisolibacter sp.]|uniref:glycosyltransferase family 4 protein n=1 Tax=Immundisolibacter sp. TaxID=1934948 RepID=UPI003EDE9A77
MKIVLVSRNYPPLVGGMERLMLETSRELAHHGEVGLVGPAGCTTHTPPGVGPIAECDLQPLWRFLTTASVRAVQMARRLRPDWVLAGSGLTGPSASLAAWAADARFAVFVHGLDLVVDQPLYRAAFLPILRRADKVIANSRYTAGLAEAAGIATRRIRVIHPGVTLPTAMLDRGAARNALGLADDRPLILTVGRLTERKGIAEFIEQALPTVLARIPKLQYLVVGAGASGALASADATTTIARAAQQAVPTNTVRMLGGVDEATLSKLYAAADLFVFPVLERADDVEGFGMAALEAAAHGLPTVAFAVGGVPDAVAQDRSGLLITPSDYAGFAAACIELLAGKTDLMRPAARNYAEDFSWVRQGERLREVLEDD